MSQTLRKRHEVEIEYTWDAQSVLPDDESWEAAINDVQEQLKIASSYKGRLNEGPELLAEFWEFVEKLVMTVGKVYIYAHMYHEVDTADPKAAGMNDRARGIFGQTMATLSFIDPELLEIGFDTLYEWVDSDSRLSIYKHYLDNLKRQQAHVRSAEVEEVLGMVMDSFRTATAAHGILADADLVFKPAEHSDPLEMPREIAQGTISAHLTDSDRTLRRTAWQNYADGYLAHKNTMASILSSGIKQDIFRARVRRYESSLEAALAGNNIPVEVFHKTVETFRQNLPIWHRYWRVRRQALGYDHLHVYDVKAPITKVNPTVDFSKAVDWIIEGMAPLGEDYVNVMRRGVLEQRWVDVYPNQGKRSGAFSTGFKGTHPFILMNYNDDLFSLSTLAHELGHSMHSYFTNQTQPFIYSQYSIFAAEVASNFNQALVRSYLLDNNNDPDFQIAVIEEAMSNFHRYFFIMPTLARFELEIHQRVEKGQALTAENMITLMADMFEEGFGDEVVVDRDRVGITWAQFPNHLYANFYVYQYTTGIAGAHALADKVMAGEDGAVDRYLDFLKAGSSLYPIDALIGAGVDLSSPEPLEKTFALLGNYVDRLENLIA